ncbi:hypothetical protein GGE12_001157 [Rhizobium mongolense]|uniref:Uncharacterized protein n=1 Tax=Rhizobium mongolense TaxID=57676 RepID=A0A7W6RJ18_9HYPH|nr:hypothetical protein [Rhizobium mongolense]
MLSFIRVRFRGETLTRKQTNIQYFDFFRFHLSLRLCVLTYASIGFTLVL